MDAASSPLKKYVGQTFQSVKPLGPGQNDRLESRSHRRFEFFNRPLGTLLGGPVGADGVPRSVVRTTADPIDRADRLAAHIIVAPRRAVTLALETVSAVRVPAVTRDQRAGCAQVVPRFHAAERVDAAHFVAAVGVVAPAGPIAGLGEAITVTLSEWAVQPAVASVGAGGWPVA